MTRGIASAGDGRRLGHSAPAPAGACSAAERQLGEMEESPLAEDRSPGQSSTVEVVPARRADAGPKPSRTGAGPAGRQWTTHGLRMPWNAEAGTSSAGPVRPLDGSAVMACCTRSTRLVQRPMVPTLGFMNRKRFHCPCLRARLLFAGLEHADSRFFNVELIE